MFRSFVTRLRGSSIDEVGHRKEGRFKKTNPKFGTSVNLVFHLEIFSHEKNGKYTKPRFFLLPEDLFERVVAIFPVIRG